MIEKNISLLGSTGSIGVSTLDVVRSFGGRIKVVALAAHSNIDLLERQAREFSPAIVAVFEENHAAELQKRLPGVVVVAGASGLEEAATIPEADIVVSAIVGAAGLLPTAAAIRAGKDIALANKEVLVAGGAFITTLAADHKVKLLPVDSEHCAIFQCLRGESSKSISRLILTASGGPFCHYSSEKLAAITVDDALRHPTWKMGAKITVDSSTLMNKGLEVIEAHWLFGVPADAIDVVIHPQSIIHSMVEFEDMSVMAQMSNPDMTLPIQYALTYPERSKGLLKPFDFTQKHTLEMFPPDLSRFPCLRLAYEALRVGGTMPCYMNAVNEVLVGRFLNHEISWTDIPRLIERCMERHVVLDGSSLETILSVDKAAREEVTKR